MRYLHFTQPTTRSVAPSSGLGGRYVRAGVENDIDWLFGTALAGVAGSAQGQFPVDLYEDKDNTYVRAELPGVAREAIGVEMVDGVLSIQATRKEKAGQGEGPVSLSRRISIPDEVQSDKVTAAYENGILTITLPRKEEAKPRKIAVSVN